MTATITRRTLAKGGAWAAPIIVASTAVPAYAASVCKPEEFALTTHTHYLNNILQTWRITFSGSAGKTISPGDTLVLDFEGLKLSRPSESEWTLSSDGKTATYIGPETAQASLVFTLDFEPPYPYNPKDPYGPEGINRLTDAQRRENGEAEWEASDKVASKITDENFGKTYNFAPANSAKCFEFLGGTVERIETEAEIDYQ